MKRIDLYMLRNFLGLFVLTFIICCFILLMQFLWMHVKDLVGKGVELKILAEFFVYAVASMVPLALPLAILLASLISFGNIGEKFELTAMKSAGISLFRIMRSLTVAIALVSVGAFFFSNNILPISQTKLWALMFSMRQKSPELDIPKGEFYEGLQGYQIYVRDKNRETGMLYDMKMYNYSDGFQNAQVLVADSALLRTTADKQNVILELYSGECFQNIKPEQQMDQDNNTVPYQRELFGKKILLINYSTALNRYDDDVLNDQHVSKNAGKLIQSIDSVHVLEEKRAEEQSLEMVEEHYLAREQHHGRQLLTVPAEKMAAYDIDKLYNKLPMHKRLRATEVALDHAKQQRDKIRYNAVVLDDHRNYIRRHQIELYRKFTLAFACLIFFFIGAPLGAIIRKGGLGAPIVISVILFIVYYIIDNTGYKMAREALWPCWAGMWLSSFVLLPIGVFLTYKAATDSSLFNPEAWIKWLENVKMKFVRLITKNR